MAMPGSALTPDGPLAGASGRELRELQQFLLYPGSALTAAAGEEVNQVTVPSRGIAPCSARTGVDLNLTPLG
jgi:hypothetical protein